MPSKAPELLGEYSPPDMKRSDWLFCEVRGKVQVGGYTDAPIPWPRLLKGGRHVHIMCEDLVRAVQTESAKAVAYWFNVNPRTVRLWRRRLGVPKNTPGTIKLHQDLFDQRIPDEARKRGLANMHTPESWAKARATKKGKPVHPNSLAALAKGRSKSRGPEWKAKIGKSMSLQWAQGERAHPNAWTEEELALLGTDSDAAVAARIGRTQIAVAAKRRKLKIKPANR